MNLCTTYLGMRLPHPLIVGAGPLGDDLDTARALEDAGAAMLVLRSLYEEEITGEQMDAVANIDAFAESFAEAGSYAPEPLSALGPDEYLEHLRLIKEAVRIPVVASLNGVTPGGWIGYSELLEQAGADGLELQIFHAASDMRASAADVERQTIEIVGEVKRSVAFPLPSSWRRSSRPSPISPRRSTRPAPTGSCCLPAFTGSTSTSTSSRLSGRCRCRIHRSCRFACAVWRRWQGASTRRSRQRRGAHRARRRQGDDGGGARDTNGLGAPPQRRFARAHGAPRPRSVDGRARVDVAR
jgi:hypothetical protein